MNIIEKVWLWKVYFNRGHSNYFMMVITIWNFIVIQYALLLEETGIFGSIFEFIALVGLTYFPIAALIGKYDYKHPTGAVQVEQKLFKEISPIYKEIYKNQNEILENQETLNNKLDEINKKIANIFLEVDKIEDIDVNESDVN